jgi:hypothetical protein
MQKMLSKFFLRLTLWASIALLFVAGGTLGAAAQEASFAVQWALLSGVPGEGASDAASRGRLDMAGKEALEWDFRRDAEELRELFDLTSITVLQQGRHLFSGTTGRVDVGTGEGGERVDVGVTLTIEPYEIEGKVERVARAAFTIRQGGEMAAAPMILARLGERAIVTTGRPEGGAILYLVIQVDAAGGRKGAARQGERKEEG